MGEPVRLELTGDEALVLLDLLSRFVESDTLATRHQAEERALWNLQCVLEKAVPEITHPDYAALVTVARERLRDSIE
jgi:hypothetical protein